MAYDIIHGSFQFVDGSPAVFVVFVQTIKEVERVWVQIEKRDKLRATIRGEKIKNSEPLVYTYLPWSNPPS